MDTGVRRQNTSQAVMASRREPTDSLEDFPTPCWSTRALLEFIELLGVRMHSVREPCANRGHMVKVLSERFDQVHAADIHDYGAGFPTQDYLAGPIPETVDWTITNPPFSLAEEFIQRGLESSSRGVAVLVRSAFLEGIGRHERLFKRRPPRYVLQFAERVVMHKGKLVEKGSTATAYCWIIWCRADEDKPMIDTRLHWIAPCRKRLERKGDYAEN